MKHERRRGQHDGVAGFPGKLAGASLKLVARAGGTDLAAPGFPGKLAGASLKLPDARIRGR